MKNDPSTLSPPLSFSFSKLSQNVPILEDFTPLQLNALKFGLGSIFLGATSGLAFGGVTTLMKGLEETPAGRANLLRSFKVFSLAGLAYGITGSSLQLIREKEDYFANIAAGCSAGVSIGIYNRSMSIACVGCVSLGALAAFSKFFDEFDPSKKSETLVLLTKQVPRSEETWNK